MRPTDKTGKKIHAWARRVHKGIYHDKEVSDAAKAAFGRAAYQTERKEGENDDGNCQGHENA